MSFPWISGWSGERLVRQQQKHNTDIYGVYQIQNVQVLFIKGLPYEVDRADELYTKRQHGI